IVIAARCKITLEHLLWRFREGCDELDSFGAVGLVVVPVEAGNIIGEKSAHGVGVLLQKVSTCHLENYGRRAEGITAGEQRPQIALAAFDGQKWNNEHPAVDAFFPYRGRHVGEVDLHDLHVTPRIKTLFLQDDTQNEIDGRTVSIDADFLPLEVL